MNQRAEDLSNLLMTSGVAATCADCGDERLFVPVDEDAPAGAYCCTSCDAAVFLLAVVDRAWREGAGRVA